MAHTTHTAPGVGAIDHPGEPTSNEVRAAVGRTQSRSQRTFTPTQAVVERSAGVYHWTPEGRRLFDYTSGVLVANLGHNPPRWLGRFRDYLGWSGPNASPIPLTAYNAITQVEAEAGRRLLALLRRCPGGDRMERVVWAASGSEAVHKALTAALTYAPSRPLIAATRHGFHGKKGLAQAVTGSEHDAERDSRVHFIRFPMAECRDVSLRDAQFDPTPYRDELDTLWRDTRGRVGTLITEPYLGGGGSYHPPKAYLQTLQSWCQEHDTLFVLDEVQSNFGRTGKLFAYETYGLEPDVVVLGKGLGNGVPVAAVAGRADVFAALGYGDTSDTWSGNPLSCAAVLATLDEFEAADLPTDARAASAVLEAGLVALKRFPFVAAVRGEVGGMVWGVEFAAQAGRSGPDWANAFVLAAYRGDGPGADGVHLLGPLARTVVRVAPPLVITEAEAAAGAALLDRAAGRLAEFPGGGPA